jgi:DNA-binding winged helix-turn-helix (wHTH) protein
MESVGARAYSFEGFTLDLRRGRLLCGNEEINLRNKSFELLKVLVESQGRLVGKEELVRAVWPDTFVGDDSLAQCLMEVRRALGDDSHHYIRTVPRRGYLFNVVVREHRPATENGRAEEASQASSAAPGATHVKQIETVKVVMGERSASGTNDSPAQGVTTGAAGYVEVAERRLRRPADQQRARARQRLWLVAAAAVLALALALSIVIIPWKSRPAAEAPALLPSQLTANPLENGVHRAAISPDGKYLAYADLNGLQILAIDTDETRSIPLPEKLCPR